MFELTEHLTHGDGKKYEMTVIFQCFCIFSKKHGVPQESLIYNILKHSFSSSYFSTSYYFNHKNFASEHTVSWGEHKRFCKRTHFTNDQSFSGEHKSIEM